MVTTSPTPPPVTYTVADDLSPEDLRAALVAGWRDFVAHPKFGLFFGAIFAFGGIALFFILTNRSGITWLIPVIAGFPLIAPFVAVGLYEVSRRRELGLPMGWSKILGALRGHGDEQIISMGVIIFVAFSFWVIIAHLVFSVFAAQYGSGAESIDFFFTPTGLTMLGVGSVIGAIIAFVFYAITVMSLPMLIDREVDFLTAIFVSLRAIKHNTFILCVWAFVIAVLLAIAMVPGFLGLFVALPVLGHATWHLYRRTVTPNETGSSQLV